MEKENISIPKFDDQHPALRFLFSYIEECIKHEIETPEKIARMIEIGNELNTIFNRPL